MRLLLVCFFSLTRLSACPNLAGEAGVSSLKVGSEQACLNKWKPLFSVGFHQPALKHQADKIARSSLVCHRRAIPQAKVQTAATSSNLAFTVVSFDTCFCSSVNDFLTSMEVCSERLLCFTGKDLVSQQGKENQTLTQNENARSHTGPCALRVKGLGLP